MFYLMLNKLKIKKNGELIGKGEIQFMSFINDSNDSFPSLQEFIDTNDQKTKKTIIENAIKNVVQSRILMPIYKVRNNSEVIFGSTGYIVYKSSKIPQDFSWQLIGIELDKKLRDNASLTQEILTKSNIDELVQTVSNITSLSSPVGAAISVITQFTVSSILKIVKDNKDDQVGYYLASFIRDLHYPNGKMDFKDDTDLTNNMKVDFTAFGVENYALSSINDKNLSLG